MANANATIAILGATRGIGRHVLEQALERGYKVRALVRPGSVLDLQHANLTVVRGDATDSGDLAELLQDTQGVLSALGAPARNKDKIRTRAARATLEAMRRTGVTRLIAVSVYGTAETREHLPLFTRAVVFPFFLRHAIADHETQERAIMDSDVDWTLIRPPYLTDDALSGIYASDFGAQTRGLTWKISRADVAHNMHDALERHSHVRHAIGISYAQVATSVAA
ncbi:MAG: NAD(P)H-binding protein [Nannocystaceae bacterium]|nr:NAD(P)H-binding protein [Nannocystaceae bacterium]